MHLRRADIVLLSISLEAHMTALRETIRLVRASHSEMDQPRIIVGGEGCLRHCEELPASMAEVFTEGGLETITREVLSDSRATPGPR